MQLKFKARDDPIELNYIPEQLFLSKLTGILAFKKFQRMGIDLEIFSSKECELRMLLYIGYTQWRTEKFEKGWA